MMVVCNHAGGTIGAGTTTSIGIQKGSASPLSFDLWYADSDRFSISIVTPTEQGHSPSSRPSRSPAIRAWPSAAGASAASLIRHPLDALSGLIAKATRVFRAAREKKLDHAAAGSLVLMLAQMRAMVETQALERLEARLEELA